MSDAAPSPGWTPERLALLRELWKRGDTASQIASVLGISRNAVLGKVHRLALAERGPESGSGLLARREARATAKAVRPKPVAPAAPRSVARVVANREALGSNGPAHVVVSLPRIAAIEAPAVEEARGGRKGAAPGAFGWSTTPLPPEPLPAAEAAPAHDRPGIQIDDIKDGACRWPLWPHVDIRQVPAEARLFCGVAVLNDGTPYCREHHARAYTPVRQERQPPLKPIPASLGGGGWTKRAGAE